MNEFQQAFPWLYVYWLQLAKTINQKRIPQALLMTGHKGLGKYALATHFAQSLLCFVRDSAGEFCGQCHSCKLFQAQTHPDYKLIEPEKEGQLITVATIRQTTTQLSLKPQFDSLRVVVINPADSLNNAAANAFLKYLEEPTERTTLILITEKPAKLPATIISRCQKLYIACPDEDTVNTWLQQHHLLENSDVVLSLSKGSPLLAKQLSEGAMLTLRTQCFHSWMKILYSKVSFNEVAEKWCKLNKNEMEFLLFWLISWVIDMIKLAYQRPPLKLYNPDFTADLQKLTQKIELRELYQYYDFLLLSQKRLDTQLNRQLMFEEILIKWMSINK